MDLVRLGGWIVVFIVLIVAAYYLFFQSPPLVPVAPPSSFTSIAPITGFSLQPEDVLNSPAFQALKVPPFALPTPGGPASVGRTNPFLSP